MPRKLVEDNPIMSKVAGGGHAHFFIKDAEHPYVQERPFDWIRGYQVGGRSLVWGRGCQRWSKYEFTAPERQGYGINWPIGYDDIAPWYSHVERFIGVTGTRDGLEAMPDGEFQPPFEFSCVEQHLSDSIRAHYGNRYVVHGRFAHLTQPQDIHLQQARGTCQARNLCMRGCPFGAYFSSNSSTLPWAAKTGNLTIRPHAVVHSILYDERKGKATGVRVIDANTHAVTEYRARIVFVNASALNTTLILLNSVSSRFPHGLGNDNGLLGKYVAFQNYRASGGGKIDGFEDQYHYGRRPSECIIPNFRNLGKQEMDFVGGYTTFTGASRGRGEADARTRRRRVQGRAGPGRAVGDLHVSAGRDDSQGGEPRPPARDAEGRVGHPAAGHLGGLRRQRRAHDPRLAHAGRPRCSRSPAAATSRRSTTTGPRAATSTRWAAAAWAATRRPRSSTAGTSCTRAPTSSSPTAPA